MSWDNIKMVKLNPVTFSTWGEIDGQLDDVWHEWKRMNYSDKVGWYPSEHDHDAFHMDLQPIKKLTKKYNWTNKYKTFYAWFRELDDNTSELYHEFLDEAEEEVFNKKSRKPTKAFYKRETEKILHQHYVSDCYYDYIRARDYWYTRRALEPYLIHDVITFIQQIKLKR